MVSEILIIVIKGAGMILAIYGGIAVTRYGFHLYKGGIGTKRDLAAFELGSFKLTAHSVGSVVMSTAFLWAWAGVALSPNLEKEKGRTHIYSFHAPDYEVEVEPVVTGVDVSDWPIKQDPQQIQGLFRNAVHKQASALRGNLKLNGQPACYDLSSVSVEQTNFGKYLITAKVKSGTSWANLAFEPTKLNRQIAFVPTCVKKSSFSESDPNNSVNYDRKESTDSSDSSIFPYEDIK